MRNLSVAVVFLIFSACSVNLDELRAKRGGADASSADVMRPVEAGLDRSTSDGLVGPAADAPTVDVSSGAESAAESPDAPPVAEVGGDKSNVEAAPEVPYDLPPGATCDPYAQTGCAVGQKCTVGCSGEIGAPPMTDTECAAAGTVGVGGTCSPRGAFCGAGLIGVVRYNGTTVVFCRCSKFCLSDVDCPVPATTGLCDSTVTLEVPGFRCGTPYTICGLPPLP